MPASSEVENYNPTEQYGGEADVVTGSGTVASGNNLARLTVVARLTADNKLVPYDPDAADTGAEKALGIMAEAVDASAADAEGPIYIGGVFNPDELVWDGAVTEAQKVRAFDGTNIALREPKYSGDVA